MSAPLVVNTKDGMCWTRRTVTSSGIALYAPEGVCSCPEFVMATLPELAELGIAGSADVLPMPAGPEPQAESLPLSVVVELNDLHTRLAGMANPPREVFLALYEGAEPELFTTVEAARECCDDLAKTDAYGKCWDWTVNEFGIHIQFWTHPDDDRPLSETSGSVTPVVVQGDDDLSELERLRARGAELERQAAVVAEFAAARAEYITAIRNCHPDNSHDYDRWQGHAAARRQLSELLGLPVAWPAKDDASVVKSADGLTALFAPTQVLPLEDPHDGPLAHRYELGRDMPQPGGAK